MNKVNFVEEVRDKKFVYNLSFLKELNSDGPFHIPEDCQHSFLYRALRHELFLYWGVSVFPLLGLSFD